MPRKVTTVIDLSFEDEGVIDLVLSDSSSEASSTGATTSFSSSSSDDSYQPKGRIFLMVEDGFNSTTFLTIVMVQMTKILTPLLMIGISNCSPVGLKSGTFHHGRPNLMPTCKQQAGHWFNGTYEAGCILNDCLF
jgi:hypothetical protein